MSEQYVNLSKCGNDFASIDVEYGIVFEEIVLESKTEAKAKYFLCDGKGNRKEESIEFELTFNNSGSSNRLFWDNE